MSVKVSVCVSMYMSMPACLVWLCPCLSLCVCASQKYSLSVQELQMWKVLSFDKNLVQFYGSCEQDGKVLLVLEYMEVQLLSIIIHTEYVCVAPCMSICSFTCPISANFQHL